MIQGPADGHLLQVPGCGRGRLEKVAAHQFPGQVLLLRFARPPLEMLPGAVFQRRQVLLANRFGQAGHVDPHGQVILTDQAGNQLARVRRCGAQGLGSPGDAGPVPNGLDVTGPETATDFQRPSATGSGFPITRWNVPRKASRSVTGRKK